MLCANVLFPSETFRIVTDALPAVDNCDATSIFYFDNQDPVDVEQSSLCVLLFSIGSNDVIAKVCLKIPART